MAGVRRALRYTGELIDAGYCPLVYPEGLRSPDGTMKPFRSGIGMMASQLRVPVVPVHVRGTFEVYSVHHENPQPGPVHVRFGAPLRFETGEDYAAIARQIQEAVAQLGA
jgi:1-acyl-sn-glycerol-3-phosphate acyltransferase